MYFLEYEIRSKQVVEIHAKIPTIENGYDYAISDEFITGEEFEKTIWVNEIDENKNLTSYSAIRNNPQAKRLLQENQQLIRDNEQLRLEMAQSNTELFEMMIAMSGGAV